MSKIKGFSTLVILAGYSLALRGQSEWQIVPDVLAGLTLAVVAVRNVFSYRR